jgi:hypothetical protein
LLNGDAKPGTDAVSNNQYGWRVGRLSVLGVSGVDTQRAGEHQEQGHTGVFYRSDEPASSGASDGTLQT